MSKKTYSAEQLSEVADVSRRQIRYYVQEGLLERPLGSTKGSHYTERHLADLLEVKRLMEKGFRLQRVSDIMRARRDEQESIAQPVGESEIEVWTHANMAAGVKLLIEPSAAKLDPQDLRTFIAKAREAYRGTLQHTNEEGKQIPFDECYERCAQSAQAPGHTIESLEVARAVEEHRQHWRPENVRVILLAESHVFTQEGELGDLHYGRIGADVDVNGLPNQFVRFVYCLGYGEQNIAPQDVRPNAGTSQFWKILYSCLHHVDGNADFAPILAGQTPDFDRRIRNKLEILRKLRERGIWLVDASILGIYQPGGGRHPNANEIIQTSWDSYVSRIVSGAHPQRLICIGRTLYGPNGVLADRLEALGIPNETLPAPQARLAAEEHLHNYRRYYEICNAG